MFISGPRLTAYGILHSEAQTIMKSKVHLNHLAQLWPLPLSPVRFCPCYVNRNIFVHANVRGFTR